MTNEQLYLASGIPVIVNVVFNTIIFLALHFRMSDLKSDFNARFDSLKEIIRANNEEQKANLRRVEEFFGARLTRIEQELKIR